MLGSAKSTRAWESEDTITEDLEEGVIDDNDYDKSKTHRLRFYYNKS